MKRIALLVTSFTAASTLLAGNLACKAAAEAAVIGKVGEGEEAGYYYLEDMTDTELEEICTSRGFELVRETNATTGESMSFTHRDYVDAAIECLQIEANLEEALHTHPEILEDVEREAERMAKEKDNLLEQLHRQNETIVDVSAEESQDREALAPPNATLAGSSEDAEQGDNKLSYDFREITLEVIDQIKSDFALVVNFLLPEKVREMLALQVKHRIQPALKTFASVVGNMGKTAFDLGRRYWIAFTNKNWGEGQGASKDEKMASEKD